MHKYRVLIYNAGMIQAFNGKEQKYQSLVSQLRTANLRVTAARTGVLAALEKSSKPLDIREITALLRKNGVFADRVTVFRVVNTLVRHGLAITIQLHEGKFRYEHIHHADHHHFVCEKCGNIEDIRDCTVPEMVREMEKKLHVTVNRHALEFFGLCGKCSN